MVSAFPLQFDRFDMQFDMHFAMHFAMQN